jgi:hypothetical protein
VLRPIGVSLRDKSFFQRAIVFVFDRSSFGLTNFNTFFLIVLVLSLDMYAILQPEGITQMVKSKKSIVSQPQMIPRPDDPDALAEAEIWCEYYEDYLPPNENCMEPVGLWYYPIFVNKSINNLDDFNGVKGMISLEFYWRNLIQDILPPESKGMILVVSNTCAKDDFTYQINGPRTVYVSYTALGSFRTMYVDCTRRNSNEDFFINISTVFD